MTISLSKTFGEDAAEVRAVLEMFGGQSAEIVSAGRRKTGAELAAEGREQAADHAEQTAPGWGEAALGAVKEFVKYHTGKFQAEDVRAYARTVPPAPSLRAWGSVFIKAARLGIIKQVGYAKVNNPLAHQANAAVWEVI